jgi:serine/threonine protein phosphatase PrpC
MVADLVDSGDLTWDEAETHPQSNAITRAVGVGDALELDKVRGPVSKGDRFILCSDGLNKHLRTPDIEAVATSQPIEIVAEALVSAALEGGGTDNVSVIVVDVL